MKSSLPISYLMKIYQYLLAYDNYNYIMSVHIVFQNITLTKRNNLLSTTEKRMQVFGLDVYNNSLKEGIKFAIQIGGDVYEKKIQFPKNIFILPLDQQITVRIDEKNQSQQKYGELSFGQGVLNFDQFRKKTEKSSQSNQNSLKKSLQFATKDNLFKIAVNYKAKVESFKIFNGHFNGILNHQQQNNLKGLGKTNNKKSRVKGDQSELKSQQETQYKTQNFEIELQGDEQILDQDLEHNFSSNVLHSSLFPKRMQDLSQIRKGKQQESKVKAETREQEKRKGRKSIKPIVFYSGPCQRKNLFSCLDQKVDEQEITFIEPVYKD